MAGIASAVAALDSGALIGLSRGDAKLRAYLRAWLSHGTKFIVPAPVLAETLRGTDKDAAVHRILNLSGIEVAPLSPQAARHAGELLGAAGAKASHTLDALIVAIAMEHGSTEIFTSDPEDIRLLSGSTLAVIHTS